MKFKTAFVDYYQKNNILPVSQDISDIKQHFQRRESLFRSVGIPANLVRGISVLEFGPGGGHNAVYTASLSPRRYDLVEGNSKGVEEVRGRLKSFSEIQTTVHHTLFDDFKIEEQFDLVWAEGCLPHQSDPLSLLIHMATFTKRRGLLCVSTNNGISYLSETLRRLFRDRYFQIKGDVHAQVKELIPYYEPHLRNLNGMSRSSEDWILDSIIQPMEDRQLLSIPQVINSLGGDFEVYGASPQFLTDWRWYKDLKGDSRKFNELALDNYFKNNLNFLDCRFQFSPHSVGFGKQLELLGDQSWELMCQIEHGVESAWLDLFSLLTELCSLVKDRAPATAGAIEEIVDHFKGANRDRPLCQFSKWWGRGQQYLSLIRKDRR